MPPTGKIHDEAVPSYPSKPIPASIRARLEHIVAPHVDSFNYFLDYGLDEAIANLLPLKMNLEDEYYMSFQFVSAEITSPQRSGVLSGDIITPREARESGTTYAGSFTATLQIDIEGKSSISLTLPIRLGELPLMLMSNKCHLKGRTVKQLLDWKEEENEVGGYFIISGLERIIRLLQVQRRNVAMAIERSSYRNRGVSYSDKGVAMRCARSDQSSVTITLHYLTNGGATLRFVLRKQEFLIPVVLIAKALMNISDQELFNRIVGGDVNNTFLTARLELLLRDFKSYNLNSHAECLAYIGSLFRGSLPIDSRTTDIEAGKLLINRFIFVHVDQFAEKLDVLIHMIRKLFTFVEGKCSADNADALVNHELLLPGHLITMYVKEKLEEALLNAKGMYVRDFRLNKGRFDADILDSKYHQKMFDRMCRNIGSKIGTFISTGNIVSSTGMDLMQVSGYTIVAERLNLFRYMSHFQSVHRGQYFTTMKTTTVRKLLPESWGFLCPVHTPDGSPCGLLNHLAKDAVVLCYPPSKKGCHTPQHKVLAPPGISRELLCSKAYIQEILTAFGMKTAGVGNGDGHLLLNKNYIPVLKDGVYLGGIRSDEAPRIVQHLRYLKSMSFMGKSDAVKYLLEPTLEIAFFPQQDHVVGPYPGLYLFTQPGRMIRPVINLQTRQLEWIGPMEQTFMEIACLKADIGKDSTHIEISPTTMLSHIASLTPYSDYNQSPRNMYQCQMGKQTMGTPAHSIQYRVDNKLYRIQNVQAPLVQTRTQQEYCMDAYPQGCNAVVAVISFTGYDMEDAMIINKGAFERGFGHGSVYKTAFYELDEEEKKFTTPTHHPIFKFSNLKSADSEGISSPIKANLPAALQKFVEELDEDGLPAPGSVD